MYAKNTHFVQDDTKHSFIHIALPCGQASLLSCLGFANPNSRRAGSVMGSAHRPRDTGTDAATTPCFKGHQVTATFHSHFSTCPSTHGMSSHPFPLSWPTAPVPALHTVQRRKGQLLRGQQKEEFLSSGSSSTCAQWTAEESLKRSRRDQFALIYDPETKEELNKSKKVAKPKWESVTCSRTYHASTSLMSITYNVLKD